LKALVKPALAFVAIGLVLYALVYYAAERLLYRTGDSNPFFKIAMLDAPEVDWVILGASHAMPLDFADFNATMEAATGLRIVNLAAPGAGPLYNRFAFEEFLEAHGTLNLLYVLDSFAFRSKAWNEDRFADSKLIARTPFALSLLRRFAGYCVNEGIDPRAVVDYAAGFSKINNRDRFETDVWEGEAQFERTYRPSRTADARRIEYLYPDGASDPAVLSRYMEELRELIRLAQARGAAVTGIKMPVPSRFYELLPGEADFDAAVSRVLVDEGAAIHDLSLAIDDPQLYFDTDHLNRTGLALFFEQDLRPILAGDGSPPSPSSISSTADARQAERM
jgi:hypothetical protein